MRDEIRIEELEIMARVGVPDEERAQPQRLTVSLVLQPPVNFGDLRTTIYPERLTTPLFARRSAASFQIARTS